ncbi:hypothetical protein [Streptomyces sp. NPDC055107]
MIAETALPGEPTVAAITKRMPLMVDIRSAAASSGSCSTVFSEPEKVF